MQWNRYVTAVREHSNLLADPFPMQARDENQEVDADEVVEGLKTQNYVCTCSSIRPSNPSLQASNLDQLRQDRLPPAKARWNLC
jgi:hypothetical protein